ncbi:MAG: hypothetical protein GY694_14545 [Gammaproteobacteria bacterium]|nr:hypothetical protein [Gammaproteobacteria bacterium]
MNTDIMKYTTYQEKFDKNEDEETLCPAFDLSAWHTDDAEWMKQRKAQWRIIQKNLKVFDLRYKHRAHPLLRNFFLTGEHDLRLNYSSGIGGGGFLDYPGCWFLILHPDQNADTLNEHRYKRHRNEINYQKGQAYHLFGFFLSKCNLGPIAGDSLFNGAEELLCQYLVDHLSIDNYNFHPNPEYQKSDYLNDPKFDRSAYCRGGGVLWSSCILFLKNQYDDEYPNQWPRNYLRGMVTAALLRVERFMQHKLEWVDHMLTLNDDPNVPDEFKLYDGFLIGTSRMMEIYQNAKENYKNEERDELVEEVFTAFEQIIIQPSQTMHPKFSEALNTPEYHLF